MMKFDPTLHSGLRAAAAMVLCSLTGCATQKLAQDAKTSQFLASTGAPTTGKIARLPFDHAWKSPALDPARYTRLVIAPVSLAHLRTGQWKESASAQITSESKYLQTAEELALYWNQSLRRGFHGPGQRLEITSNPGLPGTLILEIALTEVVFGHPGTYAASYAVPFGGVAESAMFSPTVAFEARVRDAATGKIVATASDRRGTRMKLVDFNRLTITKPNKEICDEWSVQLMQAFDKEIFPKVKRKLFTPF